MRYANLDALVIKGEASHPVCLLLGEREFAVREGRHLWGMDTTMTARIIRSSEERGRGRRSILRIGPAGENLVKYACINVDTFRHFGRLGAGAVMGKKKLKAITILGEGSFSLPHGDYKKVYKKIYRKITTSGAMKKYHDLGTPVNILILNGLKALPTRNLSSTSFTGADSISGEYFAEKLLLRQIACSSCPVGCIHIGLLREKFAPEHEYYYRQVSYDHEPIFAMGSMLGVSLGEKVISLIDEAEKHGLDVISAGVALAWATEAYQKGLIGEKETLVPLAFGEAGSYRQALACLSGRVNDFYRLLGEGTLAAAARYGGSEFACTLGQEMAGYATGPAFFVSQAMGFRCSHLDTAGYQLDQEFDPCSVERALSYLLKEEKQRFILTSMVACLFARNIYTTEMLSEALEAAGLPHLALELETRAAALVKRRWQVKKSTGFDPLKVTIPPRFYQVETIRGKVNGEFIDALLKAYAGAIAAL
jgi:aldehyde:ferredoxin oxidoreductase